MASKSLIYRKTLLKSVYRFSKVFEEVMDYEDYKQVILQSKESNYKYINLLKGLYEAHLYMLYNNPTFFSPLTVNILYNLVFLKNIEKEKQVKMYKIINKESNLIEKLRKVLEIVNIKDEKEKYAFSYILLDYLLYLKEKRFYNLGNVFFVKMYEIITESLDFNKLEKLVTEEKEKQFEIDESYYENLKEIKTNEIVNYLLENKEEILSKYKIESIYLYGSFIKNSQRIDSDIDIAGVFSDGLSYKEKVRLSESFKEYITKQFNRYTDFMEYCYEILKTEKHKKIY